MKITKKQDDRVNMTIRVPPHVHAELTAAAKYHGRFLNDEVIERVTAAPAIKLLEELKMENAEMKAMIRALLDATVEK